MEEKKKFDPTVSFMFFGSWVKTIEKIEQKSIEQAYRLYKAIANYCMYDEVPDFSEDDFAISAIWPLIENEADMSIVRRRGQFAKDEEDEKAQAVIRACVEHPEASDRELGRITGVSKSTVNRIRRKYKNEIDKQLADSVDVDTADIAPADADYRSGYSFADRSHYYHADYACVNDTMGRDSGTGEANDDEMPF